MPTILSLETSTNTCSVALHQQQELLSEYNLHIKNSHSTVISQMIDSTFKNTQIKLNQIDAIAISIGPGSYTGLRIGVSTAKGIAYALEKPIIAIDTLYAMTCQVKATNQEAIFFPMIDARRMEVYTMQVNSNLEILKQAYPLILDTQTFNNIKTKAILFGNGSQKCKALYQDQKNVQILENITPTAKNIGELAYHKYLKQEFEDITQLEPFYLKEFYTPKAKDPLKRNTN